METLLREASAKLDIAELIYDARLAAGLTQAQLAAKVGTTQSVIARLEDANYNGHSLSMLQRIAAALGKRTEIRFMPAERYTTPRRALKRHRRPIRVARRSNDL
jgi:transcriptional regulator with XRE-family HTH domain